MKHVIVVDDPGDLPAAIARWRKRRNVTRMSVVRKVAEATQRSEHSLVSQFLHWEGGMKSPGLASFGPYLQGHGLRLAVVSEVPGHAWIDPIRCGFPGCMLSRDEHAS